MRKHIYADEAGNFDFSRKRGASCYFILTTVAIDDHGIESELLELRRELAWSKADIVREFHATEDQQSVRDKVFDVLKQYSFRIDATIVEKSKALPRIRASEETFYKYAWFYHMKYVAPRVSSKSDDLMVVAASIGTKRKEKDFRYSIQDVMKQTSPTRSIRVSMWPAAIDPCLQVADYCCWAIQRKWEASDCRSYNLIKDKIRSEYDLFARGTTSYY